MKDLWDDGDDSPRPLPRPELNPLQNPLLADNLGRWAEVYFTSAPEKREQAVVELLRELGHGLHVPIVASDDAPAATAPARAASPPQTPDQRVVCPACRGTNSPTQRFCGLCGAALYTRALQEDVAGPSYPPRTITPPSFEPRHESAGPEVEWLRDRVFASTEEEQAPRGRKYVFAAVAVVLLFGSLAYLQWKAQTHRVLNAAGAPSSAGTAQDQPTPSPAASSQQATPAAPDQAPPQAAPQTAQTAPAPDPAPARVPETETTTTTASSRPAPLNQAGERTPETPTAQTRKTSAAVPIAATQAPEPFAGGQQELLQAQRYLEGKTTARDSSEAARWLWKAVGKQNSSAVLLLSDLYARGDGVPRSCDQARLLLVAATKRGATDAAAKLRNLESQGCR